MVRFTDKAREFWLEQSLDKGEMPKRDGIPDVCPNCCIPFSFDKLDVFISVAPGAIESGCDLAWGPPKWYVWKANRWVELEPQP